MMNAGKIVKRFAFGAALVCWAGLTWAGPLGELDIRGDVNLTMAGSGETLTLRNTTYTLFAGDRIATGSSAVSLRMDNGSSLAIGPDSELTLQADGGALLADLQRGSLTYLLSSNGSTLKVNGGDPLSTGQLGMIEADGLGNLEHVQGRAATLQAEAMGLLVSDVGVGVDCGNRQACGGDRPRSISP